ncbi:MAG: DUF4190 domain-containing protein [Thermoleophilia bacterium]|jgi:hypothetical protein|nr:DUF4190 domain-containing protein [Thermoleophilia bacterium]
MRGGLGFAALSGLVCLLPLAVGRVLATQGNLESVGHPASYAAVGITVAVLCGAAAGLPFAWARLAGVGVTTFALMAFALMVISGRSEDAFSRGESISLGAGGLVLVIAFILAVAGLVLQLVGAPRLGRPPAAGGDGWPVRTTSGYCVAGMVVSICGVVSVGLTAPLGVALSVTGLDDVDSGAGTRGGRGMAVAGLIVGIVITALLVLVLAVGMGVAEPTPET